METVIIKHPFNKRDFPEMVIALGFFDGVHKGHQEVILTARKEAEKRQLKCGVMTFFPHPKEVLRKVEEVQYLTSLEKKEELIASLGVDYLFIVEFTKTFAELNPQQFVDGYLIDFNVKHVVAGFDYSYGRLGKGTMETLPFHSRNKLSYTVVDKVEDNGRKISSTNIRLALDEGDIQLVNDYLGRTYETEGTVIQGEQRGRTIGYPTANIKSTGRTHLPTTGVYAVELKIKGQWRHGVCNVGYKPTFHDKKQLGLSVEVHVFDFSGNIYGEDVVIRWHGNIRSEKKFQSVEELIEQINNDVIVARKILKKQEKSTSVYNNT
ncbi:MULTISPECIES: bifunctional riboflavin kinase/FAD synthetase [Bacillaceae]|uniref:Riboflavin biosynthesis protein n=1 Tax=Evansella alkalicola TaxID=745819 RepID=A0ABS6JVT8_9BACI|nr:MULTISPECIES: bifunctional riboflavin kinase/FAD synthetase [Bacillaceae]MBU9722698.1 bifunctional riboflavin kinase/FAD synthetase [Bacillus alkalicola]